MADTYTQLYVHIVFSVLFVDFFIVNVIWYIQS